jgi:prolycopene isomerase
LSTDTEEFEASLANAFPECATAALAFYRHLLATDSEIRTAAVRWPDLQTVLTSKNLRMFLDKQARKLVRLNREVVAQHLGNTSPRFQQFINAQLQMLAQASSNDCPFAYAAMALSLPRHGMYAIEGGGGALADALTRCIQQSGGTVRLNAPVLRLVYNADGTAAGIELLNGETVHARRAIVSNLTVWDTYGKLVGHARTPPDVRSALKSARSSGAYMLYLGMDEEAAARLPADHLLAGGDSRDETDAPGEFSPFMFSATPAWDARGPEGKRAVTVWTQTDAESWFAFHSDATEIEAHDQAQLENWWAKIHECIPELGAGVEVIETETPHSHYERTRRRLGMVGGLARSIDLSSSLGFTHETAIPRLYMVGDTLYPGQGLMAVTHAALLVANELAPAHNFRH